MKLFLSIVFLLVHSFIGRKDSNSTKAEKELVMPRKTETNKPTVSFTFDDGSTSDIAGFKFKEWNQMILSHLEKEGLKAVFFVTGKNKLDKQGQFLLESWNNKGHKIAIIPLHTQTLIPKRTMQIFLKRN